MLFPQFTIRSLLALTALAAVISLVLQQAVAGALWAQCAGWTLVFVGFLFAVYAGMFLMTWGVGQLTGAIRPTYVPVASPFAAAVDMKAEVVPVNPFAPTPTEAEIASPPARPESEQQS